jgi:hypothetical protein
VTSGGAAALLSCFLSPRRWRGWAPGRRARHRQASGSDDVKDDVGGIPHSAFSLRHYHGAGGFAGETLRGAGEEQTMKCDDLSSTGGSYLDTEKRPGPV